MPKIVDHEQYRGELLDKSYRIFSERGYTALSMREIAAAIGVSTGTLYHYFPGKEALFMGVVDAITRREVVEAAEALRQADGIEARVDALFRLVARHEEEYAGQLRVLIEFYQQAPSAAERDRLLTEMSGRYVQGLMDLLALPDERIATFVLVAMNGLVLQRLLDGRHTPFEEQAQLISGMIGTYLAAGE